MEVQYTISEADYVDSIKLAVVASRRQLVWLSVGGLGLLLIAVFGSESLKPMGYISLFFGVLGYFVSLYIISPWQAKRHYKNYKSIQKPLKIEQTDGGFTVTAENGQGNVKWENIFKWRENNKYILVYQAPKLFNMIPKRIEEAGFDVEGFRRLLREKVGDPK